MNHQLINLKRSRSEEPAPLPEVQAPSLKKGILKFVLILLVLGMVAKIGWLIHDSSKWRAVFLTNNQVYFGKFVNWPFASSISLHDIYYLQVNAPLQPQDQGATPEIKVVKLGDELHSPEDRMVIPKRQVLYWENLKTSGSLVQTIQKFKTEQK